MYSLLLVDDEKLELETLRDYINWESLGFDRVYSARSGREAYDKVQKLKPDVMITDIHMPVMSGIDLARQMMEDGSKTKVIFLTGYDEFEYARAALQVSAVDYILKPFSAEKIGDAMQRVVDLIQKEELLEMSFRVLRNKLISQILEQGCEVGGALYRQFTSAHSEEGDRFGLVMAYGDAEEDVVENVASSLSEVAFAVRGVRENCCFLVRYFVDFGEAAKRIQARLAEQGVNLSVIYDTEVIPLEGLSGHAEEMASLAESLFYLPVGTVISQQGLQETTSYEGWDLFWGEVDRNRSAYHEVREALENIFRNYRVSKNLNELSAKMNEYFQYLRRVPRKKSYVLSEMDYILDELDKAHSTGLEEEEELARGSARRDSLYRMRYLDSIENFICSEELEKLRGLGTQQQETEDRPGYVVHQVKRYIENHYAEVINVEDVAAEVGISPNYMRSLFKDKTGFTLNDWITEFRMKKACELLENRRLKVKDIGQMVGYENSSYFGAVFAKRFGMTPNEYRLGKRS